MEPRHKPRIKTAEKTKVSHRASSLSVQQKRVRSNKDRFLMGDSPYHLLFQKIRDAIFVADIRTRRIVDVNLAAVRLMGYSRKKLLTMKADQLHPESVRAETMEGFKRHAAGSTEEVESLVLTSRGREVPVGIRTSALKIEGEKRLLGIFRDITERKNMERNLNDQKAFFNDVLESIQDGISILDNDLNILYTNSTMKKWYAHNLPHTGRKCFDVYQGRTKPCQICPSIQTLKSGKEAVEIVPYTGEKGVQGWQELYAFPLVDSMTSKVTGVIEYVHDITERRRMEEALRESEEKYRMIFEDSPLGILHIDRNGVVTACNEHLARILGADREKVIGFNMLTSLRNEKLRSAVTSALSGKRGYFEGEYLSVLGGKHSFLKADYSPLLSDDGSVLGVTGILEDISRRKKAEEAVLKIARGVSAEVGEKYFRSMVEHLAKILEADYAFIAEIMADQPHMIRTIAMYADGGIVDNVEFNLQGTPCESTLGKSAHSYSRDVQKLFPECELLVKMNVHAYIGIPLFDLTGRSLGIMVVMFKSAVNNIKMIESTLQIFSDRAEAEIERRLSDEALRESERSYRTLAQNLPAVVYRIFLRENNRMHFFNNLLKTMTGYSEEELSHGRVCSIEPLIISEQRQGVIREIERALSEERRFSVEYPIRHKDGTIRFFLERGTPVSGADGKPLYIDGLIYDITENKRMEEELSRAQRLETAGRIAGQIAHDFNNLLSPLMAYPDLMRMECAEKNSKLLPLLDQMQSAAIQMAEINQQLLTLGRRGHYTLEAVHLNAVIEELLGSMPIPHTVTVEKKYDPDLLPVKGGSAQLSRVFTNVIANAVESMADVGTLRIATKNVYLDQPLKSYETIQGGEYVRVDVEDTGCGISPEIINSIFDPFFTTKKADKKRGSGLGLSVVKAVIEDHNGYIGIVSRSGKGTTFSLYFPITRDVEFQAKAAEEIAGGSERLLIVDDDPVQREVIKRLLDQLGYKVHAVESGEEAVEYVKGHPQDLLILDMIMDGIDGTETFRRIREFRPDQKAAILSGYAETERVAEAQRMGAGIYIRKPVDLKSLARAVRLEIDQS